MSAALLPGVSGLQVERQPRRLSLSDRRVVWTPQAGIVADVLHGARRAWRCASHLAEDDVDRLESLRSCAAALALPLHSPQGRRALLFAHPRPGFFDPERAAVLQAVGLQVEVLLAAAMRNRDLQAEKKRPHRS